MNPLVLLVLGVGAFFYYDKQRKAKKKPVTATTSNGIVLYEVDGVDIKLDMSGVTEEQFVETLSDIHKVAFEIHRAQRGNLGDVSYLERIYYQAVDDVLNLYFPTLELFSIDENPNLVVLIRDPDDGSNIISLTLKELKQSLGESAYNRFMAPPKEP